MKKTTRPRKKSRTLYRWGAIVAGALLLSSLFAVGPRGVIASEGQAEAKVPETITINIQSVCDSLPGIKKDMKSVKDFTHRTHAQEYLMGNSEFSAAPYEDSFTCAGCHAGAGSKEELLQADTCQRVAQELEAAGGAGNLKKYFHDGCLGCHKKMTEAGKETGPVKCKGCHTP
jgi:hypothetical protein